MKKAFVKYLKDKHRKEKLLHEAQLQMEKYHNVLKPTHNVSPPPLTKTK